MDLHPNVIDIDPDSFSCSFFSFLFLSRTIAHLKPTGCLADDFMLSFKSVTEALKEVCVFLGSNCGWSPEKKPFMILKVWGEASTNNFISFQKGQLLSSLDPLQVIAVLFPK